MHRSTKLSMAESGSTIGDSVWPMMSSGYFWAKTCEPCSKSWIGATVAIMQAAGSILSTECMRLLRQTRFSTTGAMILFQGANLYAQSFDVIQIKCNVCTHIFFLTIILLVLFSPRFFSGHKFRSHHQPLNLILLI